MGGSPSIETPTPPAQPTASQSMAEYVANLPQMYDVEMQYQPKFAELEKMINEQLYPNTAGLQETMAGQVADALSQAPPDWYQENVADTLKGQLGRNLVYNPQGQEQFGLATNQANKDWGDYYRNVALSAAGRQPLAAPQSLTQSFNPGSIMGMNSATYSPYASAYSSMCTNANMAMQNQMMPFMYMQGAGNLMQGVGSMGKGMGKGMCWVAAEIFGGWEKPETIAARCYIQTMAPAWFRNFYMKFGERIAAFIKGKEVLKSVLRPLFIWFAKMGVENGKRVA